MTNRIDEIRARVAKATAGPWTWEGSVYEHMEAEIVAKRGLAQLWKSDNVIPDAAFIAHSRADIPWLISEVARLEANLRTVQNAAKTIASAQGSELEHRRQNAAYDHKLRAEHDSLIERDAIMTDENERLTSTIATLTAERDKMREAGAGLDILLAEIETVIKTVSSRQGAYQAIVEGRANWKRALEGSHE